MFHTACQSVCVTPAVRQRCTRCTASFWGRHRETLMARPTHRGWVAAAAITSLLLSCMLPSLLQLLGVTSPRSPSAYDAAQQREQSDLEAAMQVGGGRV